MTAPKTQAPADRGYQNKTIYVKSKNLDLFDQAEAFAEKNRGVEGQPQSLSDVIAVALAAFLKRHAR